MINKDILLYLAELFRYPDADSPVKVLACQEVLDSEYPEAGKLLEPFTKHFISLSDDQIGRAHV